MGERILIVGAGFAGMWSAFAAARRLEQAGRAGVEVAVVAPEPFLHVRPRFYEPRPADMKAPLAELFAAVGVRHVGGTVERVRPEAHEVDGLDGAGRPFTMPWQRLVLATGSRLHRPDVPGLREHAFSIDQLSEAAELEAHLAGLSGRPDDAARRTAVVVGAGFTGIEIGCELPSRLRAALGTDDVSVVLVEQAREVGPELGPGPRPVIERALDELGVRRRLGEAVAAIDAGGVRLASGDRIEARTVVWTAGLRASPLTEQLQRERAPLGRVRVARDLRVDGLPDVFACGDVAFAATDDAGNHALMSCQHALSMGRFAGHNAAADLTGAPALPYAQPKYVTCLDLGPWGAVYTEGWERAVRMAGADAKELKRRINGEWIYPPRADRAAILAAADPATVIA